jgi:uncharacterized FlgJ-related protein
MPLTITVVGPLAMKLESEAATRNISAEQFALNVLEEAVETDEWTVANERRLALIRRQFAGGLTSAETAELQELQHRADQYLESLDSQMLHDVAAMEKAAEAYDASTP